MYFLETASPKKLSTSPSTQIWLFFLNDFTFKMSEAGNFRPRRRRNRKKLNLESAVAEAESFLASKKKKEKETARFLF